MYKKKREKRQKEKKKRKKDLKKQQHTNKHGGVGWGGLTSVMIKQPIRAEKAADHERQIIIILGVFYFTGSDRSDQISTFFFSLFENTGQWLLDLKRCKFSDIFLSESKIRS